MTAPGNAVFASQVTRVILVDDHLVRAGLRAMLRSFANIEVVGDAGDNPGAVAVATQSQADVALIDVESANLEGLAIAARIRQVSAATRIALMGQAFDPGVLERGLAAGVRGFILKSESPERLATFLLELHRGAFCCSEALAKMLIAENGGFRVVRQKDSPLQSLSALERAILVEIAQGASLKAAARTLGVRYKTADHVKQSLMKKLGVHNRVEIARFAIREGLVK